MTHPVRAMFLAQAEGCASLGSALTARILRLLAAAMHPGDAVSDCVLNWPGDLTRRGDALALRLAGGLHALVLTDQDAALTAFYRKPEAVTDSTATALLLRVLHDHPQPLLAALSHPPQTNEVRRSAALIAAGHWLTARFGLGVVLSELGVSAGLNLIWDHYRLQIGAQSYGPQSPVILAPDWSGPQPPHAPPQITARAAVDLAPLHPTRDRIRLLSYIWADQPDRLHRTNTAADLAAKLGHTVTQGDAIDWLATRLTQAHPGHLHLICHSIAWQYFPKAAQARGKALLNAAGAKASPSAPLAHLSLETDGTPASAALTLHLWPGDKTIQLARVDFHGRWLHWTAPNP